MGQSLGQTVVVENKTGAGGTLAANYVAKAAPDGSTFGVVIAAYAANTTLYPKLPYDARKAFRAIGVTGSTSIAAVGSLSTTPLMTMPRLRPRSRTIRT